jgi:hypothetical protein
MKKLVFHKEEEEKMSLVGNQRPVLHSTYSGAPEWVPNILLANSSCASNRYTKS